MKYPAEYWADENWADRLAEIRRGWDEGDLDYTDVPWLIEQLVLAEQRLTAAQAVVEAARWMNSAWGNPQNKLAVALAAYDATSAPAQPAAPKARP